MSAIPSGFPEPGAMRCPRCAAIVGPHQDWCLECGLPARTRLAPTPNWRLPVTLVATMATLAILALGIAFVIITGDDEEPAATAPTTMAPTATAPTATSPAPPTTAPTPPTTTSTAPTPPTTAPRTTTAPTATTAPTSTTAPPPTTSPLTPPSPGG